MSSNSERTIFDDTQSNIAFTDQGTAHNVPKFQEARDEAPNDFFSMMQDMFNVYIRENSGTRQQPPPHPQSSIRLNPHRVSIDKIRKCGAEEFYGNVNDIPTKGEYWLEHTQRVLDEMLCPPKDRLRCATSLLKEEAFYWWKTIIYVTPKERVNWKIFKVEFKKKYISKRCLDMKKREFMELKQGHKLVAEYEREFIQLSKHAREFVSTDKEMCVHFEDGLNDQTSSGSDRNQGVGSFVEQSSEDGGSTQP